MIIRNNSKLRYHDVREAIHKTDRRLPNKAIQSLFTFIANKLVDFANTRPHCFLYLIILYIVFRGM